MEPYLIDGLTITLNKEGAREFSKVSFPIRYGRFTEIQTSDTLFQFNLNGEIKFIQGRASGMLHPSEWLKRTVANDWVYYSAGDYKGAYDLFGEHYNPCLSYPSNSMMSEHPFDKETIRSAIHSWRLLHEKLTTLERGRLPRGLNGFLDRIIENGDETLGKAPEKLHQLIGGPVPVLPPDTRHVDYEIIPLMVADGCLYQCGFCQVKTGQEFAPRTRENILEQMENLKTFYARDLHNYNAIFLGQHDALCVGTDLLEWTARKAYETFEFECSYMRDPKLFLFGSVDSLIDSEEALFESINRLPFHSYINVGLESADVATLSLLKKPVAVEKVCEAFSRMLEINKKYNRLEVTANFVYGEDLPPNHLPSFLGLVRERAEFSTHKGAVYLSPLIQGENGAKCNRREWLRKFYRVKAQSSLPTFLYLIQRL